MLTASKEFLCELCNFKCSKKSNLETHFLTNKHIMRLKLNGLNQENAELNDYNCKYCTKKYKARNSLWYHEQKCSKKDTGNESYGIDASNNIIQFLIKENSEFKIMVMDLVKNNTKLQEQMLEVCQKIQPTTINANTTTNTNNSHNKTFNLQFFLNEECKDAMNLKDFVNSFQLEMADLERVGEKGYVDGISHIIIEKLKETDIYKRPMHCSDAKRDTLYVKTDDVWGKEGPDNDNMTIAVKDIGKKNFMLLNNYRELHPDCLEPDSAFNDPYAKLIMNAAGGGIKEYVAKVIKNISKKIVIEK